MAAYVHILQGFSAQWRIHGNRNASPLGKGKGKSEHL